MLCFCFFAIWLSFFSQHFETSFLFYDSFTFLEPLYCLCLENVSTLLFHKFFFFLVCSFSRVRSLHKYYEMLLTSNCNVLLSRIFRIREGNFGVHWKLREWWVTFKGWGSGQMRRSQRSRLSGFYTPTNKRREEASLPFILSHLLNSWSFTSGIYVIWFHFFD